MVWIIFQTHHANLLSADNIVELWREVQTTWILISLAILSITATSCTMADVTNSSGTITFEEFSNSDISPMRTVLSDFAVRNGLNYIDASDKYAALTDGQQRIYIGIYRSSGADRELLILAHDIRDTGVPQIVFYDVADVNVNYLADDLTSDFEHLFGKSRVRRVTF